MKHKESPPATAEEYDRYHAVVDVLAEQNTSKNTAEKVGKEEKRKRKARKKSEKTLKKKAKKLKIPKTAQETIPYVRLYPDSGIIETADGVFTKTYLLDDVNYQVAKEEEQAEMFLKYAEFMNAFDAGTTFQITINQQSMDLAEFEANTLLKMKGDGLDELRKEKNEELREKIREGKNELIKNKYLTVSLPAASYEDALTAFTRQDSEVIQNVKKIGGASATPMSTAKRLELLHNIYNPESVGLFGNNMRYDSQGKLVFDRENFRFDIMHRMGLHTKDMIAPDSFHFQSNYGKVGSLYFRALFMKTVPQTVKDYFLKELTDAECKMVTSLTYQPVGMDAALKMVRNDIFNVNANMIDKQKQASKSGYSVELINPELKSAVEEANALRDDLTSKNQKLFFLTLVVVHFAPTLEQLDSDTKAIQAIGRRHLVDIRPLTYQQEYGLNACLPLCVNRLEIRRSLITESAAVFMPFVNQELNDRNGGMYYGVNAVSHNLIMLNRRNSKNANGVILGGPGTGKSVSAKTEIMGVLMSSEDLVIVIDPEGEYHRMAELLGGEVIKVAPGTGVYINPFDIEMNISGENEDPLAQKSDLITSMCETIIGPYGLNGRQRSLVDRCVKEVYESYLNSYDPAAGTYDKNLIPTLLDFYELLQQQPGYDALQLAESLEIYVTGSQNLFAYPTNVAYTKRFVVYDISEISNSMKSLGQLVVLDNIWKRIVSGRKEGRYVWFFIDEVYLLFKNASSAEFLRNLYKRARKYGGIPTGITQNVTDILENDIARTMISNCEYVQMLSQSAQDRAQLAELLGISPTEMDYITNAPPGHGLIYDGAHIVPFINQIKKDTKQYEAMTTKLSEVKAIADRKKEEAASSPCKMETPQV